MKINTKKIKAEMERQNLTLEQFGQRFKPPKSRQAIWYDIHHSKNLRTISEIARALDIDGRDLIK